MKSPEELVLARAARQHTVFTRGQALADGMTRRQLEQRQKVGRLINIHRGVYGLAGVPPSFERSLMAACLAIGGVASHRSAAALWGLRGCDSGLIEVTVEGRRRSDLPGVISHTTQHLDRIDVTERLGIPVTTPALTLLELGAVRDMAAVEAAMEDAVFRGMVTVSWLQRTLDRLGRPGRNGSGVLRQLLAARDPASGPTESELEDELVRVFQQAGLPQPRRQYEVRVPGGRSVRLDIAYPDEKLGIEANGRIWHSGREDLQRNYTKTNLLLGLGWRVLQFTAYDIRRRPEEVVEQVRRALQIAWVG